MEKQEQKTESIDMVIYQARQIINVSEILARMKKDNSPKDFRRRTLNCLLKWHSDMQKQLELINI